jgi:uncharacterized tellurite resistance protein B-like protein
MNRTLIAVAAAALCSTAAIADSKPSDDEAKKIKATLTEWGCEGGTIEKETEASGTFEVDDAKCKGAQYDIKIDSAYKLISLSRD